MKLFLILLLSGMILTSAGAQVLNAPTFSANEPLSVKFDASAEAKRLGALLWNLSSVSLPEATQEHLLIPVGWSRLDTATLEMLYFCKNSASLQFTLHLRQINDHRWTGYWKLGAIASKEITFDFTKLRVTPDLQYAEVGSISNDNSITLYWKLLDIISKTSPPSKN